MLALREAGVEITDKLVDQLNSTYRNVDELTNGTGQLVAMLVMPDGCECDLRAALGMVPGISIPIAGFGSSDCARCPAHLLAAESHAVAMTAIEQVRKAFT